MKEQSTKTKEQSTKTKEQSTKYKVQRLKYKDLSPKPKPNTHTACSL